MAAYNPKFSVVLPTYNRAYVVEEAIRSVLQQTYRDFELIVVDDNSTDDTLELLESIASSDGRMHVVSNTRTKGAAGARNMGIGLAAGEWLCQIDSDDLWSPDLLAKLAGVISEARDTIGVVYGWTNVVDSATGEVIRRAQAREAGFTYPRMLEEHFFYHGAAAFRLDVVRRVGGYDESLLANEDTDFQARVTHVCEIQPVPSTVYTYRIGTGGQLTRDYRASVLAYEAFFNKHAESIRRLPKARFSAVNPGLIVSIRAHMWGYAFRFWWELFPLAISSPKTFLWCQYNLTRELGRQVLKRRSVA